ncbi:carotenoid 1,2-hydratase [Leptospira perolatii]|uniref:Carotenoid 1,2-hydratase n=1 Tax=Leptospira perolatii TaxID=2023191 RepID=A0A2M9ZRI3_9LEPT|nr:lipocalin-like domain-containing protein [Leptospira perolatii]PJZ71157.1 carotenoid 1,2-hydratase [Leptospira perolatii]PJZ74690.1 carotenoid 1,2-hydratase [Leptospira perolatii]
MYFLPRINYRYKFSVSLKIFSFLLFAIILIPSETKSVNSRSQFQFPKDHLFHSGYKVEWCYFVGNLTSKSGKQLGYELSFFRAFVGSSVAVYPVHFAISDIANKKHYSAQALERELGNLAGVKENSLWSGDFRMDIRGPTELQLRAYPRNSPGLSLELNLSYEPGQILIHGNHGKSTKSRRFPEIYTYYYSIPRMKTNGKLVLEGQSHEIASGTSWMDHEWSAHEKESSSINLFANSNSWDWVCIQLEDGSDIMAFNFRSQLNAESETFGTFRQDKEQVHFEKEGELAFTRAGKKWTSSVSGRNYWTEWNLKSEKFDLRIQPKFEAQEFDARPTTGIIYWEGAISVEGEKEGKPVRGSGYLELR